MALDMGNAGATIRFVDSRLAPNAIYFRHVGLSLRDGHPQFLRVSERLAYMKATRLVPK